MNFVNLECFCCKKFFKKENRRYNEAIKFGWKFYCSTRCQSEVKSKQKQVRCSNPKCKKIIKRRIKNILLSRAVFCSNSCSAIINNEKRKKWKICITCGEKYYGSNKKFCSYPCVYLIPPKPTLKISVSQIIGELKKFNKENNRIPYKKEYKHTKAARSRFGTWNKAIIAAGLKPNPVKFAKVPYNYQRMTADFRIGNTYIEFFGLAGKIKSYDNLLKKKQALWKEKNLRAISIYPSDLFPKNNLEKIFNHL